MAALNPTGFARAVLPRRIPVATGLLAAAVGLASAVVALTIGVHLAGPALLRENANGATVALLGMGIPAEWSAANGAAHGVVAPGHYPALIAATLVVVVATIAVGWVRARRHPHASWTSTVAPAAAWFALLAGVTALVISHAKPLVVAGLSVRLSIAVPLTIAVAAAWAAAGMTVGSLVARHHTSSSEGREKRPRHSWLTNGPATLAVIAAVAVVGASACGSGGSSVAASRQAKKNAPASTTTSTTIAPTETTAPAAPAASAASAATRATTARAARTTATSGATSAGGTAAASAAATGWAPPTAGVYRYDTSGSTSSILGKKNFPSVTTLTVDAASGARQHSVRQLLSPNGEGFVIEHTLDYRPDGVAVVIQRLALMQSGDKTVRTLNARPPTVVIPTGAPVGTHREFDLSGMLDGHEVVDIVQAGNVTVAGQSIPAVLVRSVLQVTGSVSGTITLDQWWAPSVRLPLKEHLSGTFKSGLVTVKTTYDATLQRVTP